MKIDSYVMKLKRTKTMPIFWATLQATVVMAEGTRSDIDRLLIDRRDNGRVVSAITIRLALLSF